MFPMSTAPPGEPGGSSRVNTGNRALRVPRRSCIPQATRQSREPVFTRECGRSLTTKIGNVGRTLCRTGRVVHPLPAWPLLRKGGERRIWRNCRSRRSPIGYLLATCSITSFTWVRMSRRPRYRHAARRAASGCSGAACCRWSGSRPAPIPRDLWEVAIQSSFWSTSRFRLRTTDGRTISAYEVRIDRDIQTLPAASSAAPAMGASPRRSGGRPAAAWWDDLWVEICRQLYVGDLKPTPKPPLSARCTTGSRRKDTRQGIRPSADAPRSCSAP